MEALFVLLNAIAKMAPELEAYLRKILQYKEFKRSEVVLKEGQICYRIYFLQSGLVRIFHWLKGESITTWLLKENDIFISPQSFFGQEPSLEEIVALEACRTWSITFEELQETCRLFPEFLKHYALITGDYYLRHLRMANNLLRQSNLEKYSHLINKSPELLTRVPAKYLYSYLGLSKSTFGRARDEYRDKKGHS